MARRRLFSSRNNGYDGGRAFGSSEMRNPERELFLFQRRLAVAGVLVLLAFAGLFARFVYLQVFQHGHFSTLAESNRIAIVPIVPNRGVITDRNGVVLAQSYSAYTLELTPSKITNLDATIDELAEIVDVQPRDRKRFRKQLEEAKNFESLPLRTRLSDEEVARFAVNRYRFPGVDIKARLFRQYPYGEIAAHVIGYIGRINDHDVERIAKWDDAANYKGSDYMGKVGVELSYERELHGTTGWEQVEVDAGGRAVRTLSRTPPTAGNNLRLSIDIKLQEVAEAAFGDRRGALVAIDPAAGDILAFVSRPAFDPNLFVDGIDSANWAALNESPDKPMLNRPLRGAYPPGSTIKPYLALAALTSGKRTPQQSIFDPGFYQLPGSSYRFRDDKPGGHGSVDMYKSIVVSCDTYYYTLAGETDIDDTARFMSQLGFGHETGVDIEGELTGTLPSREWKRTRFAGKQLPRRTPQVVSGRLDLRRHRAGVQRVHADAAGAGHRDHRQQRRRLRAAPGEERHQPEDRRGACDRRAALAHDYPPSRKTSPSSATRWSASTRKAPERRPSPARSTCPRGKTGTAQVYSLKGEKYSASKIDERLRDHAWFVAYAPADQPRIAAFGAGRERRLRGAGRGAHCAQGIRLFPAGRRRSRAGAGIPAAKETEDESD